MAFFAEQFPRAADLAQKFAGQQGRIATIPDVIDARLATPLDRAPWNQFFSTNSAEYFGFSKAGNPIIVVAHGIGPMATPRGMLEVYNSDLKPERDGRKGNEGRISNTELFKLADGQYGEVAIVDFRDYVKRYEYPFLESLTAWQAVEDPLVRARLGARTEEYLKRHHQEAVDWAERENEAISKGEIEYLGIKRTRPVRTERYRIIQVADPNNSPYRFVTPEEFPLAHGLYIGQLVLRNGDSLHSEISCIEGLNPARLVGIRRTEVIDDIAQSISIDRETIAKYLERFLKPVTGERKMPELFRLNRIGDIWFTQYPKQEGSTMDDGNLEYVVKSLQEIPGPNAFWTIYGGYQGFFRYDIEGIKALAPEGANAYKFEGETRVEGKTHVVPIKFYRVDADTACFIPRREELESDFDTLMWLANQKT